MAQLEQQNEVSGPVFKMKEGSRITSIGRLLRSTSIDELPAAIQCLKGRYESGGSAPLPFKRLQGLAVAHQCWWTVEAFQST